MKNLLLACFIVFLAPNLMSQIVINEYSCSNIGGPVDGFGENEDWVEFYNTTGAAIDLTGYYLSDKSSNLTKWQIPSGSIPANGMYVPNLYTIKIPIVKKILLFKSLAFAKAP